MNKNACCVKHKRLTSIMRWKIEIGSSLRKLMEQATEFRLRLRSTGDGPSPGKVSLNTATLWHTWGYSGSTAKLNRKINHNTYLRPTEQLESKIFYTFIYEKYIIILEKWQVLTPLNTIYDDREAILTVNTNWHCIVILSEQSVLLLVLSCLVRNCCWLAVCIVVVILCIFVVLCVHCFFFNLLYFWCRTAG